MAVPSTPCWLVTSENNHRYARIHHGCGLFAYGGNFSADGWKLQEESFLMGKVWFLEAFSLNAALTPMTLF